MATIRTRTRGDNYPILVTFSVNGEPIDLTGSVLSFSYVNDEHSVLTIVGTPTTNVGEAEFIPDGGVDFSVAGVFNYDVQRVAGGYTYTHQQGTLIITDDVTK